MSNAEAGPDATQATDPDITEVTTTDAGSAPVEDDSDVVRKLRDENAKSRIRARDAETRAEAFAARLHTELVRATGTLIEPSELPFDAEHLDDGEKLSAAIESLIETKPYLKARPVSGDIGQGNRGASAEPFSLLDRLKRIA